MGHVVFSCAVRSPNELLPLVAALNPVAGTRWARGARGARKTASHRGGDSPSGSHAGKRWASWKTKGNIRLNLGGRLGTTIVLRRGEGEERSRLLLEGGWRKGVSGFSGRCARRRREMGGVKLVGESIGAISGNGKGSNDTGLPAGQDTCRTVSVSHNVSDDSGEDARRSAALSDHPLSSSEDSGPRLAAESCPRLDYLDSDEDESADDTCPSETNSDMERSERRRMLEENWNKLTRRFFFGGAALTALGLVIEGGGARLGSKKRRRRRGTRGTRAAGAAGGLPSGGEMDDDEGVPLRLDVEGDGEPPVLTDYSQPGPYEVRTVLRQEHTCSSCFPRCVAGGCLLRIAVTYPGRGPASPLGGQPFPLAIFSGGFLVGMEQYQSYANRLASWGYIVLTYNKVEGVTELLDDELCAQFISDLIDWAGTNPLLRNKVDTDHVYLCGHSRGGKVSVIAAANDPRVVALCLIDPVDNTVYAPLAPGYPSAVAALRAARKEQETELDAIAQKQVRAAFQDDGEGRALTSVDSSRVFLTTDAEAWLSGPTTAYRDSDGRVRQEERISDPPSMKAAGLATGLAVAVVGAEIASDCAPPDANYRQFFNAASAPSWEVVVKDAGHFQFVDEPTLMQNAVCGFGEIEDSDVQMVAQTAMIAWGELTVKGDGDNNIDDKSMSDTSPRSKGRGIIGSPASPWAAFNEPQQHSPGKLWGLQEAVLATASSINRKVKVSSRIKS